VVPDGTLLGDALIVREGLSPVGRHSLQGRDPDSGFPSMAVLVRAGCNALRIVLWNRHGSDSHEPVPQGAANSAGPAPASFRN